MATVVHLKWGERPPEEAVYLLVTRRGRVRGDDFYVNGCGVLRGQDDPGEAGGYDAQPPGACAYASLATALREAETVAQRQGFPTIYVQLGG